MADIYETIWQHPASHVSVSSRNANGEFNDPAADVLLHEVMAHGGNCIGQDNAPQPLFHFVNEALFEQPSFKTCIALLNNYTAIEGREEQTSADAVHQAEVDAFVDAILPTEPIQLALEHIRAHLRPAMSDGEFGEYVRRVWFEPFTNNFGQTERFCVGFEHVFVGEDSSNPNSPPTCGDSIGGYHSWIKYYLDEKAGRTNYLGHDYRADVLDDGLNNPHVATVIMSWRPAPEDGGHGHPLLKKPGGFFVGTRPECEIALGTVGLLAVLAGQFDNTSESNTEDHRRMKLGDSYFDLVLHPQTITRRQGSTPPRLGDHIRTMYPKFRGAQAVPQGGGGGGGGGGAPIPTQPHNDAAIRILRALPNPPGATDEGEWVELQNASAVDLDLAFWRLTDGQGRAQSMSGILVSGQTRRIVLTRANAQAMMLGNRGGWILLFEGNSRRAAVQYLSAATNAVIEFN